MSNTFFLLLLLAFNVKTLSNGMTVIMKEEHRVPLVNVTIVIKTGAIYESDSTLGMSHFLEHMLFDGTKTQTRQQIAERFDRKGVYFNAFTRKDYTAFMITAPSEFIEDAIFNQADMLLNSILPPSEFEKERKVIIEEMRQDRQDPYQFAEELFYKKVFYNTPYANPVIGYETTVMNMKREDVMKYYTSRYVPQNMVAIVIGDFNPQKILNLLEKAYNVKRNHIVKTEPPVFHPFSPESCNIEYQKWNFPIVHFGIALPAPPVSDKLSAAVELIAYLLNKPDVSPLYQDFRGKVQILSVGYHHKKGLNFVSIFGTADSVGSAQAFVEALPHEFKKLKELGQQDLERLKNSYEAEMAFEAENITYEAMMLTDWVANYDIGVYNSFMNQLEKVTTHDVEKVIDSLWTPLRCKALILKP